MFFWVALNENVKQAKILWTIFEICLNPKSLLGLRKSHLILINLAQTFPHGPNGVDGHAKKWVERYCELANKTTQQLYKVATPCLDDHQLRDQEMGYVGELSEVCSQIVFEESCIFGAHW